MMFLNRANASYQLLKHLEHYRGRNPLVLAIPRGAVPMAKIIADSLGGDMDVVLVRKLSAPDNPEFALGAIDEFGNIYMDDMLMTDSILRYLEKEKISQLAVMHKRRTNYSSLRPAINPSRRIVIVVDDGLATGSSMIAALKSLRSKQPEKLICAVPVAPPNAIVKIKPYADEIICLNTPDYFQSVGQFYKSFPQISDEEVIDILAESCKPQNASSFNNEKFVEEYRSTQNKP